MAAAAYARRLSNTHPRSYYLLMFDRLVYRYALVLLGLGMFGRSSQASDFRETETFAPVVEQAQEYADTYGGENVLFVVDIDNTLLAMDRDLGSDQWFEWQEYLLEHEPQSCHLVASDFEELLEVQGILFATTGMHPPEADQPEHVATIQELGVDTLVLTSRGDEYRPATIRELRRADYHFGDTSPAIRLFETSGDAAYETCSRFTPYHLGQLERYGLTDREAEIFRLSDKPRPVSYGDGVMMVAGQHKGAMLLMFLHLVGRDYDAVLYVDDHGRHVSRIYDAMTRRGIEVTTYHYTHQDQRVDRFAYGDKQQVSQQWRRLAEVLEYGEPPEPATALKP